VGADLQALGGGTGVCGFCPPIRRVAAAAVSSSVVINGVLPVGGALAQPPLLFML
jgi:hypothetical protein